MKLVCSSRLIPNLGSRFSARVRFSFFSTDASRLPSLDSLFTRIQTSPDPRVSIVPVLDKWIEEGRNVKRGELQSLVIKMKDFRRFNHALEISHWMSDRMHFSLSPKYAAIRLELIYKVHGLEQAEKYFDNISNELKAFKTYGALLNSYVQEKSVKKAEALVQRMKEMGFTSSSFSYVLMNLYSQTREYEKIDILMEEMDRKGIPNDTFTLTLRNRLSAYVNASDIAGMEKILNRMEEDPHIIVDWKVYSVVANGYLKVGLIDKALAMLKKVEHIVTSQRTKLAFEHLLTLYTRAGRKDELYRIWNLYKSEKVQDTSYYHTSYSCMITSLDKLDDIEGADKIYEEWESSCTIYDFGVLNRLLVAYCKKGHIDKAELVVNKVMQGRTPNASTWNILAVGYLENKQMSKAVEMLKKAMLVGRQGWRPNSVTLDACVEYLEGQGDVEGVEEITRLFRTLGLLTMDIYHRLLRTYLAAGKPVIEVLNQMKLDGFSADEETNKILERRPDLATRVQSA